MHECMYACMCVCMYARMDVRAYECICMYAWVDRSIARSADGELHETLCLALTLRQRASGFASLCVGGLAFEPPFFY